MEFLSFIRQKAFEKGIKKCPNCGNEDIFYALSGKCLECNQPLSQNPKVLSLLYSIEIFQEYLNKYDELHSYDEKKNILQFLKGLIHTLQTKHNLDNTKIITLQSLVNGIGRIGGESIGGAITVSNGSPSLGLLDDYAMNSSDPMARIRSLSAVILSIQYILAYPVKNEYVLDKTKNTRHTSAPQTSSSGNGGCMNILVFFAVIIITIISLAVNH